MKYLDRSKTRVQNVYIDKTKQDHKMYRQIQDKKKENVQTDPRQKYKMCRQIQDKNIKCVDRSKTTKWIKDKGMNNLTMMRNLYSYQGKTTTD